MIRYLASKKKPRKHKIYPLTSWKHKNYDKIISWLYENIGIIKFMRSYNGSVIYMQNSYASDVFIFLAKDIIEA